MGVSAWDGVFTYQLDAISNKWINNGRLTVPIEYPRVSMQKDTLVAALKDYYHHSTVSGYVYKLSTTNNNGRVTWKHRAVLTTKTDPLTSRDQFHRAVSVEGHYVYVGRWDAMNDVVGKVFVYNISNITGASE